MTGHFTRRSGWKMRPADLRVREVRRGTNGLLPSAFPVEDESDIMAELALANGIYERTGR